MKPLKDNMNTSFNVGESIVNKSTESAPLMEQTAPAFKITDKEFYQLSALIKANYGINLKEEKRALVTGRLHNVLTQFNFKSFSEYYEYLVSDKTGAAAITLINKITTNHTFFMREEDHFIYFKDKILPMLVNSDKSRDLRIWSAGCSSGEEPYTLAIIINEFLGINKPLWDTKILATDISSRVLETAISGIYENERLAVLPYNWRVNYFRRLDDNSSVLVDAIRHEVIYRKLNLMDEVFPFKRKFHVIFCRNVMIYFDNQTKNKLVNKFYNVLEPGGYLFIGHSESLNREETRFKYVIPAVYRKE